MKRFILLFSLFFFAFSNYISAQTIDSVIVSQPIECPGQTGEITVYMSSSLPDNWDILLQKADPLGNFIAYDTLQWERSVQLASHTFTALPSGIYRVVLSDPACALDPLTLPTGSLNGNACIYDWEIGWLTDPLPLSWALEGDSLDCWYDTSAFITVNNINGYTQPYTLTLFDDAGVILSGPTTLGPLATSYTFPVGLPVGDYTIEGTDFFSCPPLTETLTISSPDTLISTVTTTDITCYGDSNGTVLVSATGGTPDYTFEIFEIDPLTGAWTSLTNQVNPVTASPSHTFVNLWGGTYICTIIDDNLCDTITETFVINEAPELTASWVVDSVTCNGYSDGVITVSIVLPGWGGPYTYELWNSAGFQVGNNTTGVFPGLPADAYAIRISETSGINTGVICEILDTIDVNEPDPITVNTTLSNYNGFNISCNGECDGSITIDTVFGENGPPYIYSWDNGSNSDTTLENLCASVYTLTVTDAQTCSTEVAINIQQPAVFSIITTVPANPNSFGGHAVSCPGVCDGIITVTPTNGIDTIYYYHNNVTSTLFATDFSPNVVSATSMCGYNTNLDNGLSGWDTIVAIDRNGCIASAVDSVSEPPLLTDSMYAVDNNCGNLNGEAGVFVNGGTPPYSHNWSGPYYGVVSPVLNIGASTTPNGDNSFLTAQPYGWYIDSITDAAGCWLLDSVLIDSGYISTAYQTFVPCNADSNGMIVLTTDSVWLDQIVWRDSDTNVIRVVNTPFIVDTLQNIPSGNYFYQVQLAGCDPFPLNSLDSVIVVGNRVDMNATIYEWTEDTLACFGDFTDSIWISVVNTFGPSGTNQINQSYDATGDALWWAGAQVSIPAFNVLHSGLPGSPNLAPAGSYHVIVTPEPISITPPIPHPHANCVDTVNVNIWQPDSLQFVLATDSVLCNGDASGRIYVDTIFGGTPPYTYVWTDASGMVVFTGNDSLENVSAGNYTLSVIDSNGCDTTSAQITLYEPDPLSFTATIDAISICNYVNFTGQITVTPSGGQGLGTYNYHWDGTILINDNGTLMPFDSIYVTDSANGIYYNGPVITQLAAGDYILTLTDVNYDGSNSCIYVDTVTLDNGTGPIIEANIVDVSCYGYSDATFNATATGNGPIHFWDWNLPNAAGGWGDFSSDSFPVYAPSDSGLSPAVYGVFVNPNDPTDTIWADSTLWLKAQDGNGCIVEATFIITQPDSLIIRNITPDTVFGGFINTDSNYGPLGAYLNYNVSCWGSTNGAIDVDSVTGGTPPYYYSYGLASMGSGSVVGSGLYNLPDSTDHLFDSLGAGWYYLDVIDEHACYYRDSIYLHQPDSLYIDTLRISSYIGGWGVSCNGFSDGFVDSLVVIGGVYNDSTYIYNYTWSQDTTILAQTHLIDSLSANITYSYHVIDINGCWDTTSINLTEPPTLVIDSFDIINVICGPTTDNPIGGDRGQATVFVSGGATPNSGYTYLWHNGDTIHPTYINPFDTVGSHNDVTATADTLRVGWYNVEVWDSNGCYVMDSVEITGPSISVEIDKSATVVTQMTCASWNNASVTIVAQGPSPLPWFYAVYDALNPNDTASQGNLGFNDGLSPGLYVAMVDDQIAEGVNYFDPNRRHGCIDRDTFEIYPLDSVRIDNLVTNNVSCYGANDGYIVDIVPAGGPTPLAPYLYSLDGGPLYTNVLCNTANPSCINPADPTATFGYTFTGIAPGWHTVEIWDSAGNCANSVDFYITEPTEILQSIFTPTYNNYQIACYDSVTGSADITIGGGDSPYEITLIGPAGPVGTASTNGTYTWASIDDGWHTFEIRDLNDCLIDTIIFFAQPDAIDAAGSIITHVYCHNDCSGSVNAVITGGIGQGNASNYTYQWNDPLGAITGATTPFITNLCGGDIVNLDVTDDNGCSNNFVFSVGADILQIVNTVVLEDVSCYGDCDGEAEVTVQGGVPSSTGTYTYDWLDASGNSIGQTGQTVAVAGTNPPQQKALAVGLCAGTYTCVITDVDGCDTTSNQIIITEPTELVATIDLLEPISCHGEEDGELIGHANIGGNPTGTPPYTFTWSNGDTGSGLDDEIDGLALGQYTVYIVDSEGCTDEAEYTLDQPTEIDLLLVWVADVDCKGNSTGKITVKGQGGTPAPGIPGYYDYEIEDENGAITTITNENGNAVFTGLSSGNYTVYVEDDNGCKDHITGIFIDEPENAVTLLLEANNETCALNDAYIEAYPSGGWGEWTYDWTEQPGNDSPILTAPAVTDTEADYGYIDYTVEVTDSAGCSVTATASVRGFDNVILPNYMDIWQYPTLDCYGASIEIDIEECDGCSYQWTMRDDSIIATTSSLAITTDFDWYLQEGIVLTIIDENCPGMTFENAGSNHKVFIDVEIDPLSAACNITPGSTNPAPALPGDMITISASNQFDYFVWLNEDGDTVSQDRQFTIEATVSDCYTVYALANDGCMAKCNEAKCIAVGSTPMDAFSPNGDGYNDVWYVKDIDAFDGATVQIFNRWGELVFGPKNCIAECWDGTIDGKEAPIGTYYYIIDHNDGSEKLTGPITLVR